MQHIVAGVFEPEIFVGQDQFIMNVPDGSIEGIIIFLYSVFCKSLKVLRRKKVGRLPVCITMNKGIVKVLDILPQVVKTEHQFLVTVQFHDGPGELPSFAVERNGFNPVGKNVVIVLPVLIVVWVILQQAAGGKTGATDREKNQNLNACMFDR